MKVLRLVLLFAIAVNTASSQRRGGIRINRPQDLPSSSTRKGSRPAGSRPYPGNGFNAIRGPPPPPRRRDSFNLNYFQRRKEPFIPVNLHPPVLERPKPTPAPKKKGRGGRRRDRPRSWRKNRNKEGTPPTTEMGGYFTTTDAFTTTTYIPTTVPTTPTPKPTTLAPTTTTTTTTTPAPTTKAPTTKAPYKPPVNIVTASDPIPYKPDVQYKPATNTQNVPTKNNAQTNNTQYIVAGGQQLQDKSPGPIVTQQLRTNKIPRPPPFTRYRSSNLNNAPQGQPTDTVRVQQQQQQQQQLTVGGPLQPRTSQPDGLQQQQTNVQPSQSLKAYSQPNVATRMQPMSVGPSPVLPGIGQPNDVYQVKQQQMNTAPSTSRPSRQNGVNQVDQYQQINAGTLLSQPNRGQPPYDVNGVQQQIYTAPSTSRPSQQNGVNQVGQNQQINTGVLSPQPQRSQPYDVNRVQQQMNTDPSTSQSRFGQQKGDNQVGPQEQMNGGNLPKNPRLSQPIELDQGQGQMTNSATPVIPQSTNRPVVNVTPYSPRRIPTNEINRIHSKTIARHVPLVKPVFQFPRDSFRRPSDVPTGLKPQVLSKLSSGSDFGTASRSGSPERLPSSSRSGMSGQSPIRQTIAISQDTLKPNSAYESPFRTINDNSNSASPSNGGAFQSTNVQANDMQQTLVDQSSTGNYDFMSKFNMPTVKQQIVAAPDIPYNKGSSNNFPNQDRASVPSTTLPPQVNSFVGHSRISNIPNKNIFRRPAIEQLPYDINSAPTQQKYPATNDVASAGSFNIGSSNIPDATPSRPSVEQQGFSATSELGTGISSYSQQSMPKYVSTFDTTASKMGTSMQSGSYSEQQTLSPVSGLETVNLPSSNSMQRETYPQHPKSSYVPISETLNSVSSNSRQNGAYLQQQTSNNVPTSKTVNSGSFDSMQSGPYSQQAKPAYVQAPDTPSTGSSYSMQSGIYPDPVKSDSVPTSKTINYPTQSKSSDYVPVSETVNSGPSSSVQSSVFPKQPTPAYLQASDNLNSVSVSSNSVQSGAYTEQTQSNNVAPSGTVNTGSIYSTQSGVYPQNTKPAYAQVSDTLNSGLSNAVQSGVYPQQPKRGNVQATENVHSGSDSSLQSGTYPQQPKPANVQVSKSGNTGSSDSMPTRTASQQLKSTSDSGNSGSTNTVQTETYPQQPKSGNVPTPDTVINKVDMSMQIGSNAEQQHYGHNVNSGSGRSMSSESYSPEQQKNYMQTVGATNSGSGISMQGAPKSHKQSTNHAQSSGTSKNDEPSFGSSKPTEQPPRYPQSPGISQNADAPSMNTATQLPTKSLTSTNTAPKSASSRSTNQDTEQSKSTATSNPKNSRVQKVGKLMLKAFNDFMAKYRGAPSTKTGAMPNKAGAETQTASRTVPSVAGGQDRGSLNSASPSNDVNNKQAIAASSTTLNPRVDTSVPAATNPNTFSNVANVNNGAERQVEYKTLGAVQPTSGNPNEPYSVDPSTANTNTQHGSLAVPDSTANQGQSRHLDVQPSANTNIDQGIPIVTNSASNQGQNRPSGIQPAPNTNQGTPTMPNAATNLGQGKPSRGQPTNDVQKPISNKVQSYTETSVDVRSARYNASDAVRGGTMIDSNPNAGYQAQTANNGETKIVSGPPPPSFQRNKFNQASNGGQPTEVQPPTGIADSGAVSQPNSQPNYAPVNVNIPPSAHPPVLERQSGVISSNLGNQAAQGGVYTQPAGVSSNMGNQATQGGVYAQPGSQSSQENFGQHQTAGGRLGPAPCKMAPVCGSDGFTYMSNCFLWTGLTIACDGYCPCPSQPSVPQVPQQGALSQLLPYDATGPGVQAPQEPQPPCASCPATYSPVCTATGATYDNDCQRACNGEAFACNGECPCPSQAAGSQPCENHCPAIHAPVCSVWDHTYDNDCLRHCSGEAIACNGECPCPVNAAPQGGGVGVNGGGVVAQETAPSYVGNVNNGNVNNEPSNQPLSTCECLPGDVDPVCTTSGETLWYGCKAICLGAEIACSSNCPC